MLYLQLTWVNKRENVNGIKWQEGVRGGGYLTEEETDSPLYGETRQRRMNVFMNSGPGLKAADFAKHRINPKSRTRMVSMRQNVYGYGT